MPDNSYDVAVLGSGTGGYSAALRAAELGKSVALVERDDRLGGTCLLRGCIPTKALLQSAAVMDTVNRSEEWGIKASGDPDWSAVRAFEDKIVEKLVKGVTGLIKTRGIKVLTGTAKLAQGPAVEVGVTLHEKGFVNVDDRLRTSVEHVWAVGDVAATPLQLAHVAFTEGYAVAERIAGEDVPPIDYLNIPRVTYCSPEIASVGLTAAQAIDRGHKVATEHLDFRGI